MEPTSTVPELSSVEDFKRWIAESTPSPAKEIPRVNGHRLRAGQEAAMRLASEPNRSRLFAGLPTGYGKTITAQVVFAQRHALGLADHLLYLVPSDNLRSAVLKECSLLGELTGASVHRWGMDRYVSVAQGARAAAKKGGVVVIVTTIQQAARSFAHIESVMETAGGRWMVVFDEVQNYEHFRDDDEPGAFTGAKRALESRHDVSFTMAMTGTTVRSDRRRTDFGVPDFEVPLSVAREEKVIRAVQAYAVDYVVDAEVDGETQTMRLSDLEAAQKEDNASSLSAWELRHGVRYYGRYITDIFEAAMTKLQEQQAFDSRACMIVFCMSVNHAKVTCDTINRIYGKGYSEWIGSSDVGDDTRSQEENRRILDRFKDGKFKCLVQVNMASVGFDHKYVCVELFLNTVGASVNIMQSVGRALRISEKLDVAHIFYSPDHPAKPLFESLECELPSDAPEALDPAVPQEERSAPSDPSVVPFPPFTILNTRRDGITIHTSLGAIRDGNREDEMYLAKKFAAGTGVTEENAAEAVRRFLQEEKEKQEIVASELTEKERLDQARAQIKVAISAVTRTLARKSGGQRVTPEWHGMKQKAIHREYRSKTGLSQSDMTVDQLRAKHTWLESLHEQIAQGPTAEVPSWLR